MYAPIVFLAAAVASVVASPAPQDSPSTTTPSTPKPTGTNLPLGSECDPAVEGQCAGGAACYAVNSMLIPRCGNFQSECTDDTQCAFNKCNAGFCNGALLSSSSSSAIEVTPTPTPSPYTNSSSTTTPVTTSTSSPVPVTTEAPGTRYVNSTTILSESLGYVTSIVVVNGQTSSILVNTASTSSGSQASLVPTNGAGNLKVGLGIVTAAAVAFAWLL